MSERPIDDEHQQDNNEEAGVGTTSSKKRKVAMMSTGGVAPQPVNVPGMRRMIRIFARIDDLGKIKQKMRQSVAKKQKMEKESGEGAEEVADPDGSTSRQQDHRLMYVPHGRPDFCFMCGCGQVFSSDMLINISDASMRYSSFLLSAYFILPTIDILKHLIKKSFNELTVLLMFCVFDCMFISDADLVSTTRKKIQRHHCL